MRDLEEIKRINSEPGVGDKLGPLNGRKTYRIIGSKSPWDEPDPICRSAPNVPPGWSGSPHPDDPDNYWIDDVTGETVSALTGSRGRVIL